MKRAYQLLQSPTQTNQTDSKMKNKWETPHKTRHTKPHTTSKKNYDHQHTSSEKKSSNEILQPISEQFEMQILSKVKQFQVVSRTLKEYFKSQQKFKNSNTESIELAIKMIKAFSKTEVKKISPSFNLMVEQMMESLPVNGKKTKTKHQEPQNQLKGKRHRKEFSFANKQCKNVSACNSQDQLKQEIQRLNDSLKELKEEKGVMLEICEQFSAMSKAEKLEYISELREILEEQQKMMRDLKEMG